VVDSRGNEDGVFGLQFFDLRPGANARAPFQDVIEGV